MAGIFELKVAGKNQYMFNLKAANGEIILTSELYVQKPSALGGIASVRANSAIDGRYQRKTAKNGQPYFVLVATNGEIIGTSETYSSVAAMENGIASVKANAGTAKVDDLSSTLRKPAPKAPVVKAAPKAPAAPKAKAAPAAKKNAAPKAKAAPAAKKTAAPKAKAASKKKASAPRKPAVAKKVAPKKAAAKKVASAKKTAKKPAPSKVTASKKSTRPKAKAAKATVLPKAVKGK